MLVSSAIILLLARTALEISIDNRVAEGCVRSLELDARGVHVPNIVAVASDGGIGGHCRRSGKDGGAGAGREFRDSSGVGVVG